MYSFSSFIFPSFLTLFGEKARAGIQEVHFLPFNPTDKRTALTYIDGEGKMHRVSKGAPEQVLIHLHILGASCLSTCNLYLINLLW